MIFALPVLVPLPPGLGAIPGVFIMFWALQRLMGRATPWIPLQLAAKPLSQSLINIVTTRGLPALERLEKIFGKPRSGTQPSECEQKISCLVAIGMGFLILLPTPFLNTLPAIVVMLIGFSLINQNRRLLWASNLLGIVLFALIYSGISFGRDFIIDEFEDFYLDLTQTTNG